jgi:hypothetical protein
VSVKVHPKRGPSFAPAPSRAHFSRIFSVLSLLGLLTSRVTGSRVWSTPFASTSEPMMAGIPSLVMCFARGCCCRIPA